MRRSLLLMSAFGGAVAVGTMGAASQVASGPGNAVTPTTAVVAPPTGVVAARDPNAPGRFTLMASGCVWDATAIGADQCSNQTGHYVVLPTGCAWQRGDTGDNACTPSVVAGRETWVAVAAPSVQPPPLPAPQVSAGRFTLTASGCVWNVTAIGANQCSTQIGHYVVLPTGCAWQGGETGTNACTPSVVAGRETWIAGAAPSGQPPPLPAPQVSAGRFTLTASGCVWDASAFGANQCSTQTGHYVVLPTGCAWQRGETGANACTPTTPR